MPRNLKELSKTWQSLSELGGAHRILEECGSAQSESAVPSRGRRCSLDVGGDRRELREARRISFELGGPLRCSVTGSLSPPVRLTTELTSCIFLSFFLLNQYSTAL